MIEFKSTLDEPFDVEKEEGTPPRDLLPAGKYKAEIGPAAVGPTKNGKGQAVNLQWRITEGPHENRVLFQNILIQHESAEAQKFGRQKFKDVATACGITETITDLDILLYKPCSIAVIIRKDKDGIYQDKNEVVRVSPLVEWNKTSSSILRQATSDDMNDSIPF
jgi:hypothetical protein